MEKNLTVLANYDGSPTIKSRLDLDELEKQEIDYFINDLENPDAKIKKGRLKAVGIKLAEALFTKARACDLQDHTACAQYVDYAPDVTTYSCGDLLDLRQAAMKAIPIVGARS